MSHNIFGNRFYGFRKPAWHNLGFVSQEPMAAQAAFNAMGPYDVHMEALSTETHLPTDYRAIVRDPVPDDPEPVVFGVVKQAYHLISPQRFVEIWDDCSAMQVETMGALNKGRTLFATVKLPTFDVKGDEVQNYLLAALPFSGGDAITISQTPVRTVCQNTFVMAKAAATEVYRIIHDRHAEERVGKWMEGLYARSLERAGFIIDRFGLFAEVSMTAQMVEDVLLAVYPDPEPVKHNAPQEVLFQREQEQQKVLESMIQHRNAVRELFEGKGVGMDLLAAKGTAWGFFNAVAELENYRTGKTPSANAYNTLFGVRGDRMAAAYTALSGYIK